MKNKRIWYNLGIIYSTRYLGKMIRNVKGMYKIREEKEISIALVFMRNWKFSRKVIRKIANT